MADATELRFPVAAAAGAIDVSALWLAPAKPQFAYVLAHGAGAGMRHPSLDRIATALADRGVATLRYQFPYMEQRKSRVDSPDVAVAAVRAAVDVGLRKGKGLPVFAGGKSFGGRMTSTAQSREPLPGVLGLVFLGFPLHAPGQPGTKRAEHLAQVLVPMLFLQGDRDEFADLSLLRPVVRDLGKRATLHLVKGGDHSFAVLKKSGRTPAEVLEEVADTIVAWGSKLCATGS